MRIKKLIPIILAALIIFGLLFINRDKQSKKHEYSNNEGPLTILISEPYQEIDLYEGDYLYQDITVFTELLNEVEFTTTLISENDIEQFDWTNKTITLTSEASKRIKEKYEESMYNFEERLFIVKIGTQSVFGGTILALGSARVIDYPVMYIEYDDESSRVKFVIHSSHAFLDHDFNSDPYYAIINSEVLYEHLINVGKLVE